MKKTLMIGLALVLAGFASAAEIGGKFAFGFEQGATVGEELGRGCSFRLCLTNNIAIQGALGINYSAKLKDVTDPLSNNDVIYHEEKARLDYTAAAYGILVFRRFEHVHLNGMTGLLIAFRDNHFKNEKDANTNWSNSYAKSKEEFKKTDIHLRILMAPEIFIFPNFSLEYKYGFDVAIKKEVLLLNGVSAATTVQNEQNRLTISTVGDLDLLQSASVHFYF
ncbi:MAG: hypothetical protein V1913_05030 [Fibrobacterota bacterium]